MTDELPDIIAPCLDVLFCGINPGMSAVAAGHHFTGRGNRFWRVIHRAGFTPEEILPHDDRSILRYRCGLTAVVKRATPRADLLSRQEFAAAAAEFDRKIAQCTPRFVAFLGKAAYCGLAGRRDVAWGLQPEHAGNASIWILPNPSGRNRAFSFDRLVAAYREFFQQVRST